MDYRGLIASEIAGIVSDNGFVSLCGIKTLSSGASLQSFIKPGFHRVLDCVQQSLNSVLICYSRSDDEPFNEDNCSCEEVHSNVFNDRIKQAQAHFCGDE